LLWQPYFAADPKHPGGYAFLLLPNTTSNPVPDAGAQMPVYVTKDSGATWQYSTVIPKNARITRPWLAYSPNGVLGMFWLTQYADESFDAWAAVSPSGGPKFKAPVRLNDATSPPPGMGIGNDNATMVLTDNTLFAAWGDYRPNGNLTSWFGRYDYRGKPGDEDEDEGDE
jgi:hypothetical protein